MKIRFLFLIAVIGLLASAAPAIGQDNTPISKDLALTPPMGWNSWNKFACNVSEEMIRSMADAMVKSGMTPAIGMSISTTAGR